MYMIISFVDCSLMQPLALKTLLDPENLAKRRGMHRQSPLRGLQRLYELKVEYICSLLV